MDLRTLALTTKIDLANAILQTKEGEEFYLGNECWLRISQREFKVTPAHDPSDERDASWVYANTMDIVQAF